MIGLATGFVTGTAAHIAGRAATRRILEAVNPEFLHEEED
jgi:hypothetical protein